jgi:hypothetical protein
MHSMFQKPNMPVHFWAIAIAGKPDGRSMSLEIPSAQNSLQTNWLPTRHASTPSVLQGRTERQWAQSLEEMSFDCASMTVSSKNELRPVQYFS